MLASAARFGCCGDDAAGSAPLPLAVEGRS